jgi:Domain of unknown function (DUF4337)
VRGRVEVRPHVRFVPFFTAVIAVFAALGTLYSHHRSIQALDARNRAVLLTARATDQYNHYEVTQLRATIYQLMNKSSALSEEERTSKATYDKAKTYESEAASLENRATSLLTSFETLEIATTLFEISIAFASISALTGTRSTLIVAVCLCVAGAVIGVIGYFQVH